MGRISTTTAWKDYVAEQMKDPEFAEEYHKSKPEFDFALALAMAREARSLTQKQLAEATGIKQPMISRFERGQVPELPTLRKIAAALNARIVIEPDGVTLVTLLTA
jgi:ribosome-binding protein aMBF1 (putative translation factor)